MAKTSLMAIPLQQFDAASLIAATYLPINAAGLPAACCVIKLSNRSNVPVFVSYNGVEDHEYIRSESDLFLPIQMNSQPAGYEMLMPKGTIIYLRGGAGIGTIFLSGYYV